MAVLDVALRHFALVDLHFGWEIRAECLLQQRITFVFFVSQDARSDVELSCFARLDNQNSATFLCYSSAEGETMVITIGLLVRY